jgi:integrase/recombinase XerD
MQIPDSLAGYVESYTESLKVHAYSPRTVKSYLASLGVFRSYLRGTGMSDLREFNGANLQDYQRWLKQQRYADWTISTHVQALRRFFEQLEATQVILLNPCLGQRPSRICQRLPRAVLTIGEVKRLLAAPSTATRVGVRDRAILEVFYSSGVRLEEMTQLTLSTMDCQNGFVRVDRGKGGKDRIVPMGRAACEWVRRYAQDVRNRWLCGLQGSTALWLSSRQPHEPLKSQAFEAMVKQCGRIAGIGKNVTPHVLRHTCASHLVASGASIAHVQRLLGHASIRTTQIYVRTTIAEIKATHRQAHPRNEGGAR